MRLIDKALFLKTTPLFEELEFDTALAVADRLESLELERGEILFNKGDSAAGLYLVFQGSVRLEASLQIEELKVGDFFGDESLFTGSPRAYSCASIEKSHLLLLSKNHLFTLLSECPSVATRLLSLYASQVSLRSL